MPRFETVTMTHDNYQKDIADAKHEGIKLGEINIIDKMNSFINMAKEPTFGRESDAKDSYLFNFVKSNEQLFKAIIECSEIIPRNVFNFKKEPPKGSQ